MDASKLNPVPEDFFRQSTICKNTHSISRFSLSDFPDVVKYLLLVKKAAAIANADCGHLDAKNGERIARACQVLMEHCQSEAFMVDALQGGGGFAINGNINEAIRMQDAQAHPSPLDIKDINRSQSSADVCATALRLGLRNLALKLHKALSLLVRMLANFSHNFGNTKTLSRTCWQDALSISFHDRFLGIAHGFDISSDELWQRAQNLLMVPLGTTVIGTGAQASLIYQERVLVRLSEFLDQPVYRSKNAITSAQNFPDIALLANTVKMIAESVIRFGLDLRLLSSGPRGGLNEIVLPKVVQSSSFFPNKFNPTIVETAIQGAVFPTVMANQVDIFLIMPQIDLNIFEWPAGIQLYLGMETLTASIDCLSLRAIQGMEANIKRCRELSEFAHPIN